MWQRLARVSIAAGGRAAAAAARFTVVVLGISLNGNGRRDGLADDGDGHRCQGRLLHRNGDGAAIAAPAASTPGAGAGHHLDRGVRQNGYRMEGFIGERSDIHRDGLLGARGRNRCRSRSDGCCIRKTFRTRRLGGARTATPTTATATRPCSSQLLTRFRQHRLGIVAGADDPHHHVLRRQRLLQQECGIQPQPAVHQLLVGVHRHGHQLRLGPAACDLAGCCGGGI